MIISHKFLRFASICCFLTVFTTLGIHLLFPDPPAEFEKRVLLFRDGTYLFNRWFIIAHCLLVIISMWGFALIQLRKSPGYTGLGFLFFAVFGIAEITRQMFIFYYLNGLREQYVMADPIVKEMLKNTLQNAGLLAAPLFGVFIFSFALGNLFYGLSLTNEKGIGKLLSILLIIWAITSFGVLANNFVKSAGFDKFIEVFNATFQPLIRFLIACWIWRRAAKQP